MKLVTERTLFLILMATIMSSQVTHAEEMPQYGVGSWDRETWGNHRARVQVDVDAEAVRVHIPWRRWDSNPQDKQVVAVAARSGKRLTNLVRVEIKQAYGDLVFGPVKAGEEYWVYYMPYRHEGRSYCPDTVYLQPENTSDIGWLERNRLTKTLLADGGWKELPQASVIEIQAVSEFDRFDPMEVIATDDEVQQMLANHAGQSYLTFPEDRRHPIKMTDRLPFRWVQSGPADAFEGQARPGEFYCFQIGVLAARSDVADLRVEFGDMKSSTGNTIPATSMRCFNAGGLDWLGKRFRKTINIAKGRIQALWIGVQIPAEAQAGDYQGTVILRDKGSPEKQINVKLAVSGEVLRDAGDSDLWRHSRLRWLDSTIGLDDEVFAPYTPVIVAGNTVKILGRSIRIGATGLPASICSRFSDTVDAIDAPEQKLLAEPIRFTVQSSDGPVEWRDGQVEFVSKHSGAVEWTSQSRGMGLSLSCRAKMECDGYINYEMRLKAEQDIEVEDIRLEIPMHREMAEYMMGMGVEGGKHPEQWEWKWDINRANNMVWMGVVNGGLQCKLKGQADVWEIYNLKTSGIPEAWSNNGRGGARGSQLAESVLFQAYSGPRHIRRDQEILFRFGLLITPVKMLDQDHWQWRYCHQPWPVTDVAQAGANIINVHHGNNLNPYINYPFASLDALKDYIRQAHDRDIKVKLYYTIRELTNRVAEIWALRSLGDEIYQSQTGNPLADQFEDKAVTTDPIGGGSAWLREHLVTSYVAAWHHRYPDTTWDASIVTTGLSRWHNYYLEGLNYLVRNVGVDGLYLDGIGYDREIMKRVRKVMDRARPGCLIDFHSGNNYGPAYGLNSPANQYMELFPCIDSLWFGEGYDYDESPDYWLVEISGIPFGLYGEMLQRGGNPWRGMVYGMTNRLGWKGMNPKPIWRVWDDFGIDQAKMIGYWSAKCSVRADHAGVLTTTYTRTGKTLVSIASWADEPVDCRLSVDWDAIGLDPQKSHLYAPAIEGFQEARLFKPSDAIPIVPGRGWLLLIDESTHVVPESMDAYAGRELLAHYFGGDQDPGGWTTHVSEQPDTRVVTSDESVAIHAAANCYAYLEQDLPAATGLFECSVHSGTDAGASWGPGLCVAWPDKVLRINLRAEGRFGVDDGKHQWFGGKVQGDKWYRLRIRIVNGDILVEALAPGRPWETIRAFPAETFSGNPMALRIGKMSPGGRNEDYSILGPTGVCRIKQVRVFSVPRRSQR